MNAKENIERFIARLNDDTDFREEFYAIYRTLAPGDWMGVCRAAARYGYNFSPEQLAAYLPDGFFQGAGSIVHLGWSEFTKALSSARLTADNYVEAAEEIAGQAASAATNVAQEVASQGTTIAKKTYKVLTDW